MSRRTLAPHRPSLYDMLLLDSKASYRIIAYRLVQAYMAPTYPFRNRLPEAQYTLLNAFRRQSYDNWMHIEYETYKAYRDAEDEDSGQAQHPTEGYGHEERSASSSQLKRKREHDDLEDLSKSIKRRKEVQNAPDMTEENLDSSQTLQDAVSSLEDRYPLLMRQLDPQSIKEDITRVLESLPAASSPASTLRAGQSTARNEGDSKLKRAAMKILTEFPSVTDDVLDFLHQLRQKEELQTSNDTQASAQEAETDEAIDVAMMDTGNHKSDEGPRTDSTRVESQQSPEKKAPNQAHNAATSPDLEVGGTILEDDEEYDPEEFLPLPGNEVTH